MFDETQEKIITAAMELIMERGYSNTTTKDIASEAGINECTIFRKFKGKKDIVLSAMQKKEWNPDLKKEDFAGWSGNLEEDLIYFSQVYMKKVTPKMVKLSIGLRTPELYEDTKAGIMKIPETFKTVVKEYFEDMGRKDRIQKQDFEHLAMMFLSVNFGFVFLKASFGEKLSEIEKEEYIAKSVRTFVNGIE